MRFHFDFIRIRRETSEELGDMVTNEWLISNRMHVVDNFINSKKEIGWVLLCKGGMRAAFYYFFFT